jgi:mTERF domain-containing protein
MLRLQKCILSRLLSSTATSPISPLHRPLSAAAPAVSPSPSFAVEEYLVGTCGLTRVHALKASAKISHLKSPSNPDAVLAFLADLGLAPAVVAKDPKLLCAGVERTLGPVVVGLTGLGISRSEIVRLVSVAGGRFRCKSIIAKMQYYLNIFGSTENLLRALERNSYLLGADIDKAIEPQVAILRECGLGACDIAKLCICKPRILTSNQEHVWAMVACAEAIGVPRGSPMFRHALRAVEPLNEEKVAAKVELLKNTLRWSDAEVKIAMSKAPFLLTISKDTLQRKSEFLSSEVGLEPLYIAHRPAMLTLSLEGRLRPRYYVMKFLKENGLLDHGKDYYGIASISEKVFVEKFISPHKEAAPHLDEDYATTCKGEVPARFRFT